MLPKASHIVGSKGHMYVRIFPTLEEEAAFFGHENASPLRMRLMTGSYSGLLRSKSFGQLGNGGSVMTSRDDGWDLRDSEGWSRYRHCRPITIRDLVIPRRNRDFIAWLGGLEETRHTLAFTSDGIRFHLQAN